MSEEVLLRWDGPLQPEEGVVLHAGLPQVLTGPVVDHVEAQQSLTGLILLTPQQHRTSTHQSNCSRFNPEIHLELGATTPSCYEEPQKKTDAICKQWLQLERLAWMLLQPHFNERFAFWNNI